MNLKAGNLNAAAFFYTSYVVMKYAMYSKLLITTLFTYIV